MSGYYSSGTQAGPHGLTDLADNYTTTSTGEPYTGCGYSYWAYNYSSENIRSSRYTPIGSTQIPSSNSGYVTCPNGSNTTLS